MLLLAGCGGSPAPSPSPSPSGTGAVVSISLDDGTAGQLTNAQPVLARLQLPATFYLVSDALDYGEANLNAEQAKSLVAAGQEIGNHTKSHRDLSMLPGAQLVTDLTGAQTALASRVGVTPTTCAYPYGGRNAAVVAEAKKLFKGCRTTDSGENATGFDAYALTTFLANGTTTVSEVQAALDQARASGSWLIFTYHGVGPQPGSELDVTTDAFAAQVEAIKASGIPVQTVGAALTSLGR